MRLTLILDKLRKLACWQYLVPCLCGAVLLLDCALQSRARYMWMDEIMTYIPLSLPTFRQMLMFMCDKINCGHYAYFVLARIWTHVFSNSELSIRLFSSVGMCVAMGMIWATLRRVHGYWPATVATTVVFLSSPLIFKQNAEARFYGMLLAVSASLGYLAVVSEGQKQFRMKTAVWLAILNGLLPLTHPFGFVYSSAFLLAAILADWRKRAFRPWYYISSLAGWLFFIPFIPAFLKQSELSKPHYWVCVPSLRDLRDTYFPSLQHIGSVLGALILALVIRQTAQTGEQDRPKRSDEPSLLILGGLLVLAPVATWIQSHITTSLFQQRYVIVFELGWAILLSAALVRILPTESAFRRVHRVILSLGIAWLLISPIRSDLRNADRGPLPGQVFAPYRSDLPLVTADPGLYLGGFHYGPDSERLHFILDWECALRSTHPHETQDFQMMQALKRHDPKHHVVETEEFLEAHPEFVVFEGRNWFEVRVRKSPQYEIEDLGGGAFLARRHH